MVARGAARLCEQASGEPSNYFLSRLCLSARLRAGERHVLKAAAITLLTCCATLAQPDLPSKVPIAFDRYYDTVQLNDHLRALAAAYPDLVTLKTIGKSTEGRDLLVAIVNNPKTGPDTDKPAMWIDGNIHGNEVQCAEVVLYTLWYLTKSYGANEKLTKLIDSTAFYLMATVNPDGRQFWFDHANTPHSSRHNQRKIDHDLDGAIAEDAPDDLDKDGQITQMWKEDLGGQGRWVRSQTDDRIFTRLRDDQSPSAGVKTYTHLGEEGIDNDEDGRINEDGPFGDDMNRNWPSDWQPEYVQGGAGLYPFSNPEPRAIGAFILARPNIAAVQSYHNTGGMILRGPGASYREGTYPQGDVRAYDEIARIGEELLPYYKSMIIYRDLYTVHGGFVNWTAEGLGIFSFTNEMWHQGKYFQREAPDADNKRMWLFRDHLEFGQTFTPYKEFTHPTHGPVLIGGLNKWSSRVTPTFMLEEECHRNFAFTMFHAKETPRLAFGRTEVTKGAAPDTWIITTEVKNDRLIPSRSGIARQRGIGAADILTVSPAAAVSASGTLSSWNSPRMDEIRREPARIQVEGGIPGRGGVILRFYVSGKEGEKVKLKYVSEKARGIEREVELK